MAGVTVCIPGLLVRFADGQRTISLRADTVAECFDRLVETHPTLEAHLFDGDGRLREHLQLFVDGQRVERFDRETVPLADGSTVTVLQAVSGG